MINIEKQITHWKKGAEEDWEVARDLVNHGRIRHGLFFAHLALEKVLKAHVCKYTQDLAPRIHRLPRLAELASLTIDPVQLETLILMGTFNLEGRYPGLYAPEPTQNEAQVYLRRTEELYQWLMNLL